jgi:hypothetical protein
MKNLLRAKLSENVAKKIDENLIDKNKREAK